MVWAAPMFIYGPIATAEAKIRYKRNGQWHSKNEYMFASPLPREWRLEVIPYADYEIQIREATGVERKWGPLSNTCSFRTPEGGLFVSYTTVEQFTLLAVTVLP